MHLLNTESNADVGPVAFSAYTIEDTRFYPYDQRVFFPRYTDKYRQPLHKQHIQMSSERGLSDV